MKKLLFLPFICMLTLAFSFTACSSDDDDDDKDDVKYLTEEEYKNSPYYMYKGVDYYVENNMDTENNLTTHIYRRTSDGKNYKSTEYRNTRTEGMYIYLFEYKTEVKKLKVVNDNTYYNPMYNTESAYNAYTGSMTGYMEKYDYFFIYQGRRNDEPDKEKNITIYEYDTLEAIVLYK